jgi:F-type H+-transporting ATPase subunit epsilon
MMASLATGIISFSRGGTSEQVAVGSGYVEIHDDKAVVLTDRFSTKGDVDPVLVRRDLKEADDALDAFTGDRSSAEHAQLVSRELWAAALLELYGDPPPPTLRGFSEAAVPENFVETASDGEDEDDEDGA